MLLLSFQKYYPKIACAIRYLVLFLFRNRTGRHSSGAKIVSVFSAALFFSLFATAIFIF